VRGAILKAFEAAELETDPAARAQWLTFVVVGAGPPAVGMAGQIAELARDALPGGLPRDGRARRSHPARGAERPSPADLPAGPVGALGVTPLTGHTVVGIDPDGVDTRTPNGAIERVLTETVIWAAGVTASPLAGALAGPSGADVDRSGRVTIEPDLTLTGHPEVLAIGDMVRVCDLARAWPRTFPGWRRSRCCRAVTRDALSAIASPDARRRPSATRDKGKLATIGRARAVADLRLLRLAGLPAWLIWVAVHLIYLIGFQKRVVVLVRWAYSFVTRNRGARLIT
jgi:NADH:ubiquinone reductase (H+-translocating)